MSPQESRNRFLLACICFLGYFIIGTSATTVGILIPDEASFFHVSPGDIGMIYSTMNGGNFLAICLSGLLISRIRLKTIFTLFPLISIIAIAVMDLFAHIRIFTISIFFIGFVGGLLMSAGAYLLIQLFSDIQKRTSKLVFADFFFSFAAMTMTMLFSNLMDHGVHWYSNYLILAGFNLLVLVLALKGKFPTHQHQAMPAQTTDSANNEKWKPTIYLVSIAALLLLFAELALSAWLPEYGHQIFGLTFAEAGKLVSSYWLFKTIGLFINQYTVRHLKIKTYLRGSIIIGALSILCLTNIHISTLAFIAVCLLGFINSGIYASLISYGSLQVKVTKPGLVAFIIATSTLGTFFSTNISGWVYNIAGVEWAANTATIAYLMCAVLIFMAIKFSVAEKLHQ